VKLSELTRIKGSRDSVLDNQSKLAITDLSGDKERKVIGNENFMPKEPALKKGMLTVISSLKLYFRTGHGS